MKGGWRSSEAGGLVGEREREIATCASGLIWQFLKGIQSLNLIQKYNTGMKTKNHNIKYNLQQWDSMAHTHVHIHYERIDVSPPPCPPSAPPPPPPALPTHIWHTLSNAGPKCYSLHAQPLKNTSDCFFCIDSWLKNKQYNFSMCIIEVFSVVLRHGYWLC